MSEIELKALRAMVDKLAGDNNVQYDVDTLRSIKKRFAGLRFAVLDASGRKSIAYLTRRIDAALH